MHQPWASLLVHGIKRIEGRSWSSSAVCGYTQLQRCPSQRQFESWSASTLRFTLHKGSKTSNFPSFIQRRCCSLEELVSREELPQSIRMEALSECCWLCEEPQKLVIPFQMRGWQGVYNLEKKIASAAVGGLKAVQGPGPVKFSGLGVSSKSPGKAIKNT
ncbi:activating signal cointegrator 1 isoform X3 [Selaginella moellendorffii]|uniref:activating signal cointegrator 1 isoform X3 n=1 Tax=Selaginella moellendorffii TaxID=88036 RepID=UPI000D1D0171|nr:activating signal cointegrator 1 isoform X3 [Selaginella moellendorffii]|eukprot:XP_024524676.1 activating signal cointegrator 1 isoform X3 [Selaginella moellendorffii]